MLASKVYDKDQADDPWSFVPIFHSESTRIEIFQQRGERHLKKRNESSKQRDEDHHTSNHSSIILDDARTLAAIFIRYNMAAPFPRRDDTWWSTRWFLTKQLNSPKP
jgi:hypothetical protein